MTDSPRSPRRPGPGVVLWGSVALFAVLFALLTFQLSSALGSRDERRHRGRAGAGPQGDQAPDRHHDRPAAAGASLRLQRAGHQLQRGSTRSSGGCTGHHQRLLNSHDDENNGRMTR